MDCARNNLPTPVPRSEILSVISILEAISVSSKEGREIRIG